MGGPGDTDVEPERTRPAPWWRQHRVRQPLVVVCVVVAVGLIVFAVVERVRDRDHRTHESLASPGRRLLAGFGEVEVRIVTASGRTGWWCLLLAETPEQRTRGLMYVTDRGLDRHAGMLFRYHRSTTEPYWMRNTRLPLSIAFFDARGQYVSSTDMAPCNDAGTCPTYPPAGPYRLALEVPQGQLGELGVGRGSRLEVVRTRAPACPRSAQPAVPATG